MVYEKFVAEFKRMLKKYPNKPLSTVVKHLFHGSRQTDPKLIYASEDGLDIRFANPGAMGSGIYLASDSLTSDGYRHTTPGGKF